MKTIFEAEKLCYFSSGAGICATEYAKFRNFNCALTNFTLTHFMLAKTWLRSLHLRIEYNFKASSCLFLTVGSVAEKLKYSFNNDFDVWKKAIYGKHIFNL